MHFAVFLVLVSLNLVLCQPPLPVPARDIPKNLNPPLAHGRVDVHGWLWLPTDVSETNGSVSMLVGWFYHHTPEFFYDSPHNFEIMAKGSLALNNPVSGLPLPPTSPLVGTEYVFTPPAFSLDDVIVSALTTFHGKFSNGSFDTPQRYLLSNGTISITELVNVLYLDSKAPKGYHHLVYLSYPRFVGRRPSNPDEVHLYFLHLLEKSPDFDQIVHVVLNASSCENFMEGKRNQAAASVPPGLYSPGATFVVEQSRNDVLYRLSPKNATVNVAWIGPKRHYALCKTQVLEEIHCVTVPDSFANCPPVKW